MSATTLTPPSSEPHHPNGPACDECRQRKVKCDRIQPACGHCTRNGWSCGFSGRVKRVNHTRQLVDDVAGLNDRLDNIDGVTQQLMERMDAITELLQQSRISQSQPRSLDERAENPAASSESHALRETVEIPDNIVAEAPNLVQSQGGLERFYGSFSTHALFHTARKIVEALVVQVQNSHSSPILSTNRLSLSPSIVKLSQILDQASIPQIIQCFNTWSSQPYDEDDLDITAQPIALPPIRLLEESLRYLFDDSCWEWPIFRKESVLSAVQAQYASNQQVPDIAWTLCFNNIILLSLGSKQEATGTNTALMTKNAMITSLVDNAKLGIHLTPYLMSPRLVNVQALLSLALVARDFIHYSIFERAMFCAHQVASMMGLQEEYGREVTSEPQNSERRDLLWTIYALDKQRCFLRGAPCLIYQFECSVTFPTHENSIFKGYWLAQIQLTCVMEDIYRALYSPRSKRLTSQQLEESLRKCDRQLKIWSSRHGPLLATSPGTWSIQTLFAQQLRYSYYSSLILVHRRGSFVQNQQVCLESAREALKIVQIIASGVGKDGQAHVALRRIFNSCSVMAYYELWVHVLYSPCRGYTGDLALLMDFSKALDSLTNPIYPQAYCARVARAIKWCTEVVRLVQDIKLPTGTASPNLQFPTYSTAAQLGAWELLAPAFFSNSPYGYDFVGGGTIGFRGQSPADVEMSLRAARPYMTESQQQFWTQQPNLAVSTGQQGATNVPQPGQPFATTDVPFEGGIGTTLPMATDLTGDRNFV